MRFLILTADYPEFLDALYRRDPGLAARSYHEQDAVRAAIPVSIGAAYARELQALGHEATVIYANNRPMQLAWQRAAGGQAHNATGGQGSQGAAKVLGLLREAVARTGLRRLKPLFLPLLRSLNTLPADLALVLAAQVAQSRPDVILNLSMVVLSPGMLRPLLQPHTRLIGQHAATALPDYEDYRCYDLIVSSFPPTVAALEQQGLPAAYLRLGFDPEVLGLLRPAEARYPLSFIGSLMHIHSSRIALLDAVCAAYPQARVWVPDAERIPAGSAIRQCYAGSAFGQEMFQIMADSRMTLNHHGDVAPYANNMRLYEATGVGTLLLTDARRNLAELFDPGREVVSYQDAHECIAKIGYYLQNEDERASIAKAGQARTLRDHNYALRVSELLALLANKP